MTRLHRQNSLQQGISWKAEVVEDNPFARCESIRIQVQLMNGDEWQYESSKRTLIAVTPVMDLKVMFYFI